VFLVDTSTYHYKSRRPGQAALEQRIKEICQTRVRYGYRRVHVLLRRAKKKGAEGQPLYEVELEELDLFDPESAETDSVRGDSVPCCVSRLTCTWRGRRVRSRERPTTSQPNNGRRELLDCDMGSDPEHQGSTRRLVRT
jgi:hypothetical protein